MARIEFFICLIITSMTKDVDRHVDLCYNHLTDAKSGEVIKLIFIHPI